MTRTDIAPMFDIVTKTCPGRKELWRLERATEALPAKWVLAGVYAPDTDDRTLRHHAGNNARFLPARADVLDGLTARRQMADTRAKQGVVRSPEIERLSKQMMAEFERAVEIMWFPDTARMNQELDWAFGLCQVLVELR